MKLKNIEEVNNPIIYISLSLIIASLTYGIYSENIWLAVLTVSLFLLITYLNTNLMFSLIIVIFLVLGVVNNLNYYSIDIKEDFKGEINIVEIKDYYTIANYKGRLIYIEGKEKSFKVGNDVEIRGKFNKELDVKRGILGTVNVKEVVNIKENLKRKLYIIREEVYNKLKENIGERKSALVSSAAFGYTDFLDEEDKEEMRSFGVIHAVSVSGLHVALVYGVLKYIMGVKIGMLSTILYVLLTGGAFSSIRALIMILLLNLAIIVKKTYNPLGAIAFSAGIITLVNPYAPFKLGFQLSFLATSGIILFNKKINRKLYKLPKYLRSTLSISISAQIFTLPIMMYNFGECSLTFLIGNLILIPLLNLIIYLGNSLLIFIYVSFIFDFISYILYKIIKVFDIITSYFDYLFNGSFYINEKIILLYVSIMISLFLIKFGKKNAAILPLATFLAIYIYIYSPILKINYIENGGILISYRGERKVLTNKRNIDMNKLKKQNLADEGFREGKNIRINNIKLEFKEKNYILKIKDKEYLLRLSNKKINNENYDIINFIDKDVEGFYILNNNLYCY